MSYEEEIQLLHEKACAEGKNDYRDPKTGYVVFTKVYHLARGFCCGSGCRHCPYDHVNVGKNSRKSVSRKL